MNNYTSNSLVGDSLSSQYTSSDRNELLDFIRNWTKSFSQYVSNDIALKSELAELEAAASNCTKYNFGSCANKVVKFLSSKRKIVQEYAAELLVKILKFAIGELLKEQDPSILKSIADGFIDIASEISKARGRLVDKVVIDIVNNAYNCCKTAAELYETKSREDRLTSLSQTQDSFRDRNTDTESITNAKNKNFDKNNSIDKFENNNHEINILKPQLSQNNNEETSNTSNKIDGFYSNGLYEVSLTNLFGSDNDILGTISSFTGSKINKDNCIETIEDLIPLLLHKSPTVRKEAAYTVATALDIGSIALVSEKDIYKKADLLIGMNRVIGKLTRLISRGLIKNDVKSIISDSLQDAKTTVDEVIKELEMMDLPPELIKKLQEGGIFLKKKRNEELIQDLILSEIDPSAVQQLREIMNKLTGGKTMKEIRGELNQIIRNMIFGNQNPGSIQSPNTNLNSSMLRSELFPTPLGQM